MWRENSSENSNNVHCICPCYQRVRGVRICGGQERLDWRTSISECVEGEVGAEVCCPKARKRWVTYPSGMRRLSQWRGYGYGFGSRKLGPNAVLLIV